MVVRFDNLVTEVYKNEDGSETCLQINTTMLLNIYFEPGFRTNKGYRKQKVGYKGFQNKHPFLSKFYNPYSGDWYTCWYRPRVVFNYGNDRASFNFSNNANAEKFYAAMTKKYFGK